MKLIGKISDISLEFLSGKPKITFQINNKAELLSGYDSVKDKEQLSIEIKPYRKKRSLNANAYAWVLMDKIAETQGITKEEVYWQQIREIGIFKIATISENAVNTLVEGWNRLGLGWVAERLDNFVKDGLTDVMLYYGSSVYNTKQMTRLIDNIVQDCKALGIETKTPEEIKNMLSLWERERDKKHTAE